MRLKPELLLQIDNARDLAHISSRTEFVETACQVFIGEKLKNRQHL